MAPRRPRFLLLTDHYFSMSLFVPLSFAAGGFSYFQLRAVWNIYRALRSALWIRLDYMVTSELPDAAAFG